MDCGTVVLLRVVDTYKNNNINLSSFASYRVAKTSKSVWNYSIGKHFLDFKCHFNKENVKPVEISQTTIALLTACNRCFVNGQKPVKTWRENRWVAMFWVRYDRFNMSVSVVSSSDDVERSNCNQVEIIGQLLLTLFALNFTSFIFFEKTIKKNWGNILDTKKIDAIYYECLCWHWHHSSCHPPSPLALPLAGGSKKRGRGKAFVRDPLIQDLEPRKS